MSPLVTLERPSYVSADWFRCTRGMTFTSQPPSHAASERALASLNPWERLVCVTLRAQRGEFSHSGVVLDIIHHGPDDHLRDCAVRIFALSAPSEALEGLATAFEHSSYDTRIEAYRCAALTGDLALAEALVRRRSKTRLGERELVMDNVSDILEPDMENLEFAGSSLNDEAYGESVRRAAAVLRRGAQPGTYFLKGRPLSVHEIIAAIKRYCQEEEFELFGGSIANLFSLLEGMTGVTYASCLDDDCNPILPRISHVLNRIQQSGVARKFEAGRRYFFGHRIP
jgi:hypothetical protein